MKFLILKGIAGYYVPLYEKNDNVYCYLVHDRRSYFNYLSHRPKKFFNKENIIDTINLTLEDAHKIIKALFEEDFE